MAELNQPNQPQDQNQIKNPIPQSTGDLNPAPATQNAQPAQPAQNAQPSSVSAPAQTAEPNLTKAIQKKEDKTRKKNILSGCLILSVLILAFVFFGAVLFLSQPQAQDPILQLFGIDRVTLSRFLITLSNIGFGFFAFIAFIISVIGFFKTVMTKKEDIKGKKSGILMLIIGIAIFFILIFLWISSYFYLKAKQPPTDNMPLSSYILTEPFDLTALTAPVTISFDASNFPVDATKYRIMSYRWNFGDGEIALGPKVSHTYKSKGAIDGRYNVELQITAKNLSTNQEEVEKVQLEVFVYNERVNAEFEVSAEKGEAPFTVDFDGSKSIDPDGEIISYEWDFNEDGDYSDAKGEEVEYTFDQIGKYKVSLRVTDNNGEWDTFEKQIEAISPEAPQAVIAHNNTASKFYVGEIYTFEGSDSTSPFGSIVNYAWSFGDNTKAETRTVKHSYEKAGAYMITLEVTDETGKKGKSEMQIEVSPEASAPIPVISTVPAKSEDMEYLSGAVPFTVKFDASASKDSDNNIIDYEWDFESDGNYDETGKTATHIYSETGEYTATLRVTDADRNQRVQTLLIQVGKQDMKAVVTAEPIDGEVPLKVTFDASGSSYPTGKIVSYEWDFGDGNGPRIAESIVTYNFYKVGTFNVKVTALASDGKKADTQIIINVRPVALKACFTPSVNQGDSPLTVTFDPRCSQGTVAKYLWDFQGATSRERKPTHTFKNPGAYTVTLEITDNQNLVSTYSETIVVKGRLKD